MQQMALVVAALGSLAVTSLSGFLLIPLLRRLKFGQTINEIGPTWHKDKQGTPTMGGFMFALGSCVGILVAYPFLAGMTANYIPGGLGLMLLSVFTSLAFGCIGFVDDYLKIVRHQNLGLHARGKLILQCLVTLCFLVTLHMMGHLSTQVTLPFFGLVDFSIFFYPLSLILIIGLNNAVNLTDGIDGLCTSVTLCVMLGYMVLLVAGGYFHLATWAAALAGGCVGYLFWNFYPAKVFMGDTGSLFLGGAVVSIGYAMGRPDLMILLSIVYLLEAFSVMLQVSYFKITKGKRIFKMSPIHHHFEMSGWSEVKIVVVFSLVTIAAAVAAYYYAFIFG